MEVCNALPNFFWACAHIIRKVIRALQITKGDGHRDAVDIVLGLLNRFIRDQIEICPFWKAAAHQAVLVFNKTFFLRFACMRVITLTPDDGFKEWPVRKLHPVVHRQSVHAQANENRDDRPRVSFAVCALPTASRRRGCSHFVVLAASRRRRCLRFAALSTGRRRGIGLYSTTR